MEPIRNEWRRNVHTDDPDLTWEDLDPLCGMTDEALPNAILFGFERAPRLRSLL